MLIGSTEAIFSLCKKALGENCIGEQGNIVDHFILFFDGEEE